MLVGSSLALVLADAVLFLHVGVVVFVVVGLPLIVVGNRVGWRWVNAVWLRMTHAAAIGIVVCESWFGIVCPLTTLERWLRVRAGDASYGGGFVEHWTQRLLFYDLPPWMFIAAYTAFGSMVLASWWLFPPRRARPVA